MLEDHRSTLGTTILLVTLALNIWVLNVLVGELRAMQNCFVLD